MSFGGGTELSKLYGGGGLGVVVVVGGRGAVVVVDATGGGTFVGAVALESLLLHAATLNNEMQSNGRPHVATRRHARPVVCTSQCLKVFSMPARSPSLTKKCPRRALSGH